MNGFEPSSDKINIFTQLSIPRVNLMGVSISNISGNYLVEKVVQIVLDDRKSVVANVNIHAMNLAYQLPWFRDFLNNAPIVFCDGYGVMLGAHLMGLKIHHRFTPPDWIPLLCQACVQHEFSIYLLGSCPGVARQAADRLREFNPSLRIVGTHHGYFDKTPGSSGNQAVVDKVNAVKPNILFVGFGMPIQEKWIMENLQNVDVSVVVPVGAALEYLSGKKPRAPRWMTDHGLEWIGRLIVEPSRLWKRYIIGNPLFFLRIVKYWILPNR
jgi:N-acetylglucosaminyldiphosphoundecaprenol N-acetyl-beta-D-mannosaminyltransferase